MAKNKYKVKKTILFVVNADWFFLSHRLAIAQRALEEGFIVHLAAEITDKRKELEAYGLILHDLQMKRSSTSLLQNLGLLLKILKIYKKLKPDLIHLITIKPVIIGSLAAHLFFASKKLVLSISGLGYVFTTGGFKAFFRKEMIILLYKLVFMHRYLKVIFQNKNDLNTICDFTNLNKKNTILIPGSGVDLDKFRFKNPPKSKPIVLFPARIIASKGIYEFVDCAKKLNNIARFVVVGKRDVDSRDCIKLEELEIWEKDGIIEYWGDCDDMPNIFSKSSIVVLPSYREGMPKSLLEAAASGRPVVTTNIPGCRDAIINGLTGFLVPLYDVTLLTKEVKKLLENPKMIRDMGEEGRLLAEKKFDLIKVVNTHLKIYNNLLSK